MTDFFSTVEWMSVDGLDQIRKAVEEVNQV